MVGGRGQESHLIRRFVNPSLVDEGAIMGTQGFCICMLQRPTAWDKQLRGLQDVGLYLDIRDFCRLQGTSGLGQEFFQQWNQQVILNPAPDFHKRGKSQPCDGRNGYWFKTRSSTAIASSVPTACNRKEMQSSLLMFSLCGPLLHASDFHQILQHISEWTFSLTPWGPWWDR